MGNGDIEGVAPAPLTRLPFSSFNTSDLPQEQAFAGWQEQVNTFVDVRPHDKDEAFFGSIHAFLLGGMQLGMFKTTSQSWDRSRFRIGRDGLDHYGLQIYLNGSCGQRDGANGSYARKGDLFICDLAQPHRNETISPEALYLMVPRAVLAPLLKAPDAHNCRLLSGHSPLVTLLREHLQILLRQAPAMSMEEAGMIVSPTLQLVAAAINAQPAEVHASGINLALTMQIRHLIELNLLDAALSAEAVAAHFGISTRKLYYLMESSGGFTSYVQEARLRRARADLLDPRQSHRSIAEIAQAYGFAHRKSFIRAFRRLYDIGPREMRQLGTQGTTIPPRRSVGDDWRHWMYAAG
ncbi:helix-turn-helix domain-containing protein [Pelagibacterium limicola]|uniref:helix-turn-helix domain-containing protein n=1 Tax=Pelagibacterium limicola TaxID=2791022 RepID=UPI0018AFAE52|nr:helix-turn-helix domain-containing protein [Pelagibacterium limicola]